MPITSGGKERAMSERSDNGKSSVEVFSTRMLLLSLLKPGSDSGAAFPDHLKKREEKKELRPLKSGLMGSTTALSWRTTLQVPTQVRRSSGSGTTVATRSSCEAHQVPQFRLTRRYHPFGRKGALCSYTIRLLSMVRAHHP
jgi:hypothetical protein